METQRVVDITSKWLSLRVTEKVWEGKKKKDKTASIGVEFAGQNLVVTQ